MKDTEIKVLLIEDDEDDYILTSEILGEVKGTTYKMTWVARYSEGLDALKQNRHDVCLVDYRLGEGNGIELITEAVGHGCLMPMILLTGQDEKEIDIEGAQAGAADYLTKRSLDAPGLERAIRYALAHGRTLQTLRESESRFRSVVESANDAIILTDQCGRIISWNRTAETIFGYGQDDILGKGLSFLFPASYYQNLSNDDIDPLIASVLLQPGSKAIEFKGLKQDGAEFPVEVSLSSWSTAEGVFYSGIVRDVTERKSLEDQLTHQALHDPLTKLANRVLFRNRVAHALSKANRNHVGVGVLFLDLDNFKTINDTLGHAAGDELLVSVARRLESCLRTSDTAARLGGDEFAVLVEDTANADGPLLVANRIREMLKSPFMLEGKDVFVGTSIGIATTTNGRENPEELLRNADVAMYNAKAQGKDRYTVFENEMHEALMKRAQLESDMRLGIYREEFEVHYQPIIDLTNEKIMGMEALARWNHPVRGLVSPIEFIPIAEESNLIIPLGRWVLHEACRKAFDWQKVYGFGESLSVTVNISSKQFRDSDLLRMVEEALAMSGLSPACLILEITESTMLLDTDATTKKLADLKSLGIRLAIDDFGTGYSSLSYLQRFPVDILKIDKSFVDKIAHGKEGAAVAKAIITMSDTLHLRTIAEGIESQGQSEELKNLGCELGQGYYFAKPLHSKAMSDYLRLETLSVDERHGLAGLISKYPEAESAVAV